SLHAMADGFSEEPTPLEREAARLHFMISLPLLYPCPTCRKHLAEEVSKYPVDTASGPRLSRWLVFIHNQVNKRLGKLYLSYEQAMAEQAELRSLNWGQV